MKDTIINMYHNFIIKRIEKLFYQDKITNTKEKKELDYLYLRILLAIEDEINYCIKKRLTSKIRLVFF